MRRSIYPSEGIVTTVVLAPELHSRLREFCRQGDTSIRAFVSDATVEKMDRIARVAAKAKV